jgi:hypothetical protein
MGVHGSLYRWLVSYLLNRSQLVTLNGYESLPYLATSGIPRGSNLGPLLFLIFINDLLQLFSSCWLAYADDIKINRRIADINDCRSLHRY